MKIIKYNKKDYYISISWYLKNKRILLELIDSNNFEFICNINSYFDEAVFNQILLINNNFNINILINEKLINKVTNFKIINKTETYLCLLDIYKLSKIDPYGLLEYAEICNYNLSEYKLKIPERYIKIQKYKNYYFLSNSKNKILSNENLCSIFDFSFDIIFYLFDWNNLKNIDYKIIKTRNNYNYLVFYNFNDALNYLNTFMEFFKLQLN